MVTSAGDPLSAEAPQCGTAEEGLHGRDPNLNLAHFSHTSCHDDIDLVAVLAEAAVSCGSDGKAQLEGGGGSGAGGGAEEEEDGAGRELHLGGELPPLRVREFSGLEDESGAVVWDAALVLLHHLDHMHHTQPACSPLSGRSVVELGCGPGAVGLAAAVLMGAGSSSSSGTGGGGSSCGNPTGPQPRVLLTDLPHLLPHVRGNVRTCRPARSAPVDVLPLEWGNAAHLRAVQAWHVAAAAGRLRGGGAGHLPQGEQPGRQGPPEDVVESSYPAACQGNKPGTCGADGVGAEVCGRKTAATAADGERGGNRSGSAGGGGGGRLGLLVLGSDLVYSAASRPALVATVADLLRGAAVAARGTGGAAGGPGVGAACVARGAAPEPLALLSFEDRPGVEELPGLWRRHGLEATEVEQQLLHPDWRSPELHVWRLRLAPCATDS